MQNFRLNLPDDRRSTANHSVLTIKATTVVAIVHDIWHLRQILNRNNLGGVPEGVFSILERLTEDLEAAGITWFEPTGEVEAGSTFEIAYIDGEATSGPVFVAETLLPGVKLDGKLIAAPVIAGKRGSA